MKIKLKIPYDDTLWPSQYRGKETIVDVANLRFPDGVIWSVSGDIYDIPSEEKTVTSNLAEAIGCIPKRITIET